MNNGQNVKKCGIISKKNRLLLFNNLKQEKILNFIENIFGYVNQLELI